MPLTKFNLFVMLGYTICYSCCFGLLGCSNGASSNVSPNASPTTNTFNGDSRYNRMGGHPNETAYHRGIAHHSDSKGSSSSKGSSKKTPQKDPKPDTVIVIIDGVEVVKACLDTVQAHRAEPLWHYDEVALSFYYQKGWEAAKAWLDLGLQAGSASCALRALEWSATNPKDFPIWRDKVATFLRAGKQFRSGTGRDSNGAVAVAVARAFSTDEPNHQELLDFYVLAHKSGADVLQPLRDAMNEYAKEKLDFSKARAIVDQAVTTTAPAP